MSWRCTLAHRSRGGAFPSITYEWDLEHPIPLVRSCGKNHHTWATARSCSASNHTRLQSLHHVWRWDGLEASRPPSSNGSSPSSQWAFVPPSSKGRVRSGIFAPFVGQRSIQDFEGFNAPRFGFDFSGIEEEQTRAKVGSMPPFGRGACFPR